MIVPRNRLLVLAGGVTLPASIAVAAAPAALSPVLGIVAVMALICLLDALDAVRRIRGLRVDFPGRINLSRNRDATLDFAVYHDRLGGALYIGLGLPVEVRSPRRVLRVELPAKGERVAVTWPVIAQQRGEYLLARCYFRIPSRFGLWTKQGSLPAGTRILVHPDLLTEQKRISALFPRLGGVGVHAHRQIGRGREFEKLRDYQPGDSMSDVHWRMTAKRNRLVTKEYQLERTQDVYVAIDASRLSARSTYGPESAGGAREPFLEQYIRSALLLGDYAQRQGDRFGLFAFSNRMLTFIRAGSGREHFRVCHDAVLKLQAQVVTPDFEELAGAILQNLRRRVLLLILANLDDPSLADGFLSSMEAVGRRHVVLVNMIRHPAARPLFSDSDVADNDAIYGRLGGHLAWQNLRQIAILLRRRGIGFALTDRENLSVEMISRYINVKRRQVL